MGEVSVDADAAALRKKRLGIGRHSLGTYAFDADIRRCSVEVLTVCRTIIAAHGGSMTAQNRPEGGALMRFTLPIKEENNDSETQHSARRG